MTRALVAIQVTAAHYLVVVVCPSADAQLRGGGAHARMGTCGLLLWAERGASLHIYPCTSRGQTSCKPPHGHKTRREPHAPSYRSLVPARRTFAFLLYVRVAERAGPSYASCGLPLALLWCDRANKGRCSSCQQRAWAPDDAVESCPVLFLARSLCALLAPFDSPIALHDHAARARRAQSRRQRTRVWRRHACRSCHSAQREATVRRAAVFLDTSKATTRHLGTTTSQPAAGAARLRRHHRRRRRAEPSHRNSTQLYVARGGSDRNLPPLRPGRSGWSVSVHGAAPAPRLTLLTSQPPDGQPRTIHPVSRCPRARIRRRIRLIRQDRVVWGCIRLI